MADDNKTGKPSLGVVRPDEKSQAASETKASSPTDVDAAAAEANVREQLEALRAEIGRLKESAGLLAEGTGQLALAKVNSVRDDVEELVVANPFTALLGAAFVGYLFGLRHR